MLIMSEIEHGIINNFRFIYMLSLFFSKCMYEFFIYHGIEQIKIQGQILMIKRLKK